MTVQIVRKPDGTYIECDRFKVTGKYAHSKRNFPAIHTYSIRYAEGINLWRGTVWGHNIITGKWCILWRVFN